MKLNKKVISVVLFVVLFGGALILLCCCDPYHDVCVNGVCAQLDRSDYTATVYRFEKDPSVGQYEAQDCYVPETIYYNKNLYTVTALNGLYYNREIVSNGGHAKRIVVPSTVTEIDFLSFSASDNYDYLEAILVHKDNPNYADVDGVMYDKSCTTLIMYPPAKRDETMVIRQSVTEIYESQLNYSNKYVSSVSVETGNTVYSAIDGMLFSQNGTLLEYVPYGYDEVLELPSGVTCIAKWALRYANVEHMYLPESVVELRYPYAFYNPLRYVRNLYFEAAEPTCIFGLEDYLNQVNCGVSREEFRQLTSSADNQVI